MNLDFASFTSSIGTTRPATALGATVTPVQNAMSGAWASIFSALPYDVCGIWVNINSGGSSNAARDLLVDIGVDPAGGTSYVVAIPYLLGLAAPLAASVGDGGINYFFPLYIKAGSTVAARASVNNATVGTVRVWCAVWALPANSLNLRLGTRVEAIGIVSASSRGTTVTPGTTSEGAWTDLGTSVNENWWWQAGCGCNDASMTALSHHLDIGLGDASNKDIIIQDQIIRVNTTTESLAWATQMPGCVREYPAGEHVYGRLQCSGTSDSNMSVAAWGLGG